MHYNNVSASIIIPTFNERDNIHELLERIQRSMGPLRDPFEILIVDDNSPDETWKVLPITQIGIQYEFYEEKENAELRQPC
jgi:glycosyltransferase involved in cell wall biosynthesis